MANRNRGRRSNLPRRTVLKVAGGAAGAAGLVGLTTGQESQSFRLDGESSGWVGREPSSIEGDVNPTLTLEPGTEYEVVWENTDGAPHNFAILDAEGSELVRSEIVEGQGETQTVTFTAEEAMAEYYCEVHPVAMRGEVQVGEGGGGTETPDEGAESVVPQGPSVGLEPVAQGLTSPVTMEYAEEDRDRRFVADQTGQIYVHDSEGLAEEPFLDVSDRMIELQSTYEGGFEPGDLRMDERGLTGLAFHPEFADNGLFYVHYSSEPRDGTPDGFDHTEVISEFQAADDMESGDPDSERVLLEIPHPQFNHNAGPILFGPDGYLYVTMGDGGGANDTGTGHVEDWYDGNEGGNGQDVTENLLGNVLRIDVDSEGEDTPYGIPEDNPLVGEDGRDEIFAWGLRNPWRATFNDGTLLVADVGQALYEEVNVVENGGNYGWNVKEGTVCFDASNPGQPMDDCPSTSDRGAEFRDPVVQYPHSRDGTSVGVAVVGGYVYDGEAIPDLQGRYVFGDWTRDPTFREARGVMFAATPPEGWADGDGTGTGTPTGTETGTATESGTPTESTTGTPTGTPSGGGAETSIDASDGGDLWPMEELVVSGGDGLGRYVIAFARDREGELYVLTSGRAVPEGDTGEVLKLVPGDEGAGGTTGTATGTGTAGGTDDEPTTEGEGGTPAGEGETTTDGDETPDDEGGAPAEGEETTETDGPGFGVLAALGAAGAAGYLATRRSDDGED